MGICAENSSQGVETAPTSSLNGWIDRETDDEGEWEFAT